MGETAFNLNEKPKGRRKMFLIVALLSFFNYVQAIYFYIYLSPFVNYLLIPVHTFLLFLRTLYPSSDIHITNCLWKGYNELETLPSYLFYNPHKTP
jgi:hypothetical protein